MKFQSALALKKRLISQKTVSAAAFASAASLEIQKAAPKVKSAPKLALGITGKKNSFKIAIRIQQHSDMLSSFIHDIRTKAKGEVDIKFIGTVRKQAVPWHQKRNRPLRIGGSVGHFNITAGTLGCFVTKGGDDFILSNNHVLADENRANKGDVIVQPGPLDGGIVSSGKVGQLHDFIKLKRRGTNLVDCATASMDEGLEYFYNHLETLGPIKGVRKTPLEIGETVFKVGRTTGVTKGEVDTVALDQVDVGFDMGVILFDDQIQIGPVGNTPFSLGGDSGSLIVDSKRRAVGLLFAGNDVDATFANPIQTVLDKLKVDLVF